MNFDEYVSYWRNAKKNKPNQDIIERWETRIVPNNLHTQGPAGGDIYLAQYGKGIGSPKCIMFARYAEEKGFPYFAMWFWEKAYSIDFPGKSFNPFDGTTDRMKFAVGDPEIGQKSASTVFASEKTSQEPRRTILTENPHIDT